MLRHAELEITNLKGHFKLKEKVKLKSFFNHLTEEEKANQLSIKINFSIFREPNNKKLVFTIFHDSQHVNITGFSSDSELQSALSFFNTQFDQNISVDVVKIDNITAVGYIWNEEGGKINLIDIENSIRELNLPFTTVSLRPEFFPGAVIRTRGAGTVILFSSGKYIIVGTKTPCQLKETHETFLANIRRKL